MKDITWLQQASEWLTLIQPLIWALVGWGWWSLKKVFVKQEDCKQCRSEFEAMLSKLDKRQDGESVRQESLEKALGILPTSKDMQAIALAIKAMEGDMKALTATVGGQERALGKVEKAVDELVAVHLENRR